MSKKDLRESLSYYNILKNLLEIEENSVTRKQGLPNPQVSLLSTELNMGTFICSFIHSEAQISSYLFVTLAKKKTK